MRVLISPHEHANAALAALCVTYIYGENINGFNMMCRGTVDRRQYKFPKRLLQGLRCLFSLHYVYVKEKTYDYYALESDTEK